MSAPEPEQFDWLQAIYVGPSEYSVLNDDEPDFDNDDETTLDPDLPEPEPREYTDADYARDVCMPPPGTPL